MAHGFLRVLQLEAAHRDMADDLEHVCAQLNQVIRRIFARLHVVFELAGKLAGKPLVGDILERRLAGGELARLSLTDVFDRILDLGEDLPLCLCCFLDEWQSDLDPSRGDQPIGKLTHEYTARLGLCRSLAGGERECLPAECLSEGEAEIGFLAAPTQSPALRRVARGVLRGRGIRGAREAHGLREDGVSRRVHGVYGPPSLTGCTKIPTTREQKRYSKTRYQRTQLALAGASGKGNRKARTRRRIPHDRPSRVRVASVSKESVRGAVNAPFWRSSWTLP
ncbi:MAG: hypothetical protein U0441_20230 [Polyangiaceae bacterium]